MKCKTIDGMRECFACKQVKPINEFYHRMCKGKKRPYSTCKECQKIRSKHITLTQKERISLSKKKYYLSHKEELKAKKIEYYQKNKERYSSNSRRNRLKIAFNITIEEYNQMLVQQDNKCSICGCGVEQSRYGLVVDHDHITNKVRSLLCNSCNTGIGFLKENPVLLQNAIDYINKYNNLNFK